MFRYIWNIYSQEMLEPQLRPEFIQKIRKMSKKNKNNNFYK